MSQGILSLNKQEETLRQALNSYSEKDKDFWSFRGRAVREHSHGYFQYPAMMVPQMQGELIDTVLKIDLSVKSVFDPFVWFGNNFDRVNR